MVIGRVTEVGQRRWKVDTHAKLDAVLMLSSVNLPGGELVSGMELCGQANTPLLEFASLFEIPCVFCFFSRIHQNASVDLENVQCYTARIIPGC